MLKRLTLYISGASLRILLFFGLTVVCFAIIATNPAHIKDLVKDTGIYDNLVPTIINDTLEQQQDISIPLSEKPIQKSIESSFTPEIFKKNTDKFIDQTYLWLDGGNKDLVFKIDFSNERQLAADKIANIAFTRVKTLPVCFAVPETIDPFTVGCQPPQTDLAKEEKNLSSIIAGEEGILPKAVFTNQDLPKNNTGQYIYEKYSFAPTAYKWLKYSPYIIVLIIITLSVIIVFLSRTKREGLRRLGTIFVGSGITLIITPLILSYILPSLSSSVSFSSPSKTSIASLTNNLMTGITNDFYALLLNISIQVIVIGATILLAEKMTRPKSKYADVPLSAGIVSSHVKKPSSNSKYKPDSVPLQSSEESTRRKPKKTRNGKYRKIPGKGDKK